MSEQLNPKLDLTNIEKRVKSRLRQLELQHGVNILFAAEVGEQAFEFPYIPESINIHYVYVRPLSYYLSVNPRIMHIDGPNGKINYIGYDLKYLLNQTGDTKTLEFLFSSLVYRSSHSAAQVKAVVNKFFSPRDTCLYYANRLRGHLRLSLAKDVGERVKYYETMRCLLAANWIIENGTLPDNGIINSKCSFPQEIEDIWGEIQEADTEDVQKSLTFNSWLWGEFERIERMSRNLPIVKLDYDVLNSLFFSLVVK
jgi:predicted nucleotidyltransferase